MIPDDAFPDLPASAPRLSRRTARRSPLFTLIVLVTPAPIAAWIVFHYDLPGKLHAWLHRSSQAEDADVRPGLGPPSRDAPGDRPTRARESTLRNRRQARSAVAAPPEPASGEEVAGQALADAMASAASTPAVAHEIVLDLAARKQVHRLSSADDQQFHVIALAGCSAPYEIAPRDAMLEGRRRTTITIEGPRPITLALSVQTNGSAGGAIVIEPTVATDHGRTFPFTIPELEDYERDVAQSGNRALDDLRALEAERGRLQLFINAPMAKPLAARGQARTAVMQLDNEIAACKDRIRQIEQDLDVAKTMVDFARQLKKDCRIQLSDAKDSTAK